MGVIPIETYKLLTHKKSCIAVIGLGYVGLPLAVAFANKVRVIGYDSNTEKIAALRSHIDRTGEVGSDALKETTVEFTNDAETLHGASFFIIAVPTPIKEDCTPDLTFVQQASCIVGKHLRGGSIVVYESTVYPGVTEEVCIPELERESGMRCGIDFFVGYSPERINPGDKVHTLKNICKIVSGVNQDVCNEIAKVYELVVDHTHQVSSIKVAEAAKLLENTQRDINIALMNEAAMIFDKMGISTMEVVKAMNTKWNALGFRPGLVGGHCIGVDPYYLIYKAALDHTTSQLVATARQINNSMSRFIVDITLNKMIKEKHSLKNDSIYFFGITFKENCPDIRNSRAIDMVTILQEYDIHPKIIDPWADKKTVKKQYGIDLMDETDVAQINDADCLIFAVEHAEFSTYSMKQLQDFTKHSFAGNKSVVIDVKSMFDKQAVEAAGLAYWSL